MRNKTGREITLLFLPILAIGGVGWFLSESHPKSIKPVGIYMWSPDSYPKRDNININLTLEWDRSWLHKFSAMQVQSQCVLLDAKGTIIATQKGYNITKAKGENLWDFSPFFVTNLSYRYNPFAVVQGTIKLDNSAPIKFNYLVPRRYEDHEVPRTSKLAFKQ